MKDGSPPPTLEVIVRQIAEHLHKVMRPDIGIALIDLDWSHA